MSVRTGSGSPTLLLVPTSLELEELERLGGFPPGLALVERCGFGPIAAAAITARLLEKLRPRSVVLVGIAGSHAVDEMPLGSAASFAGVALDGLDAAGFEQAPGIGAEIELTHSRANGGLLVTVIAPSSSTAEAVLRKERFPRAVAEDMEGFGVALSCSLAGVPLAIVRGISNAAGDRDRARWKTREALAAARELAIDLLREP